MADNERSAKGTVFTLRDFTECYTPPRTFKVLGGRGLYSNSHTTALRKGDSLYLHTLAVEWICLSFWDTGVNCEVKVPPDSPIRFKIIHKSAECFERIYTTVGELLDAWPTIFQANYGREDPYLPQIFKKGERFKFIRRAQNPNDRQLYMECEDESGNVFMLPSSCRGDFTLLDDPASYTLQEIVSYGDTERVLKLSEENIKLLEADNTENLVYHNVENNGDILAKITGLPLSYNGLITMHKPKFYVIVSPQDNHDVKWKISLEEDIEVMELDEFLPQTRDMSLTDFVENFELDLPVIARISNNEQKLPIFEKHLSPGTEVIIHRVDKDVDRILATTKSDILCLGSDVKGRFRKSSRRFKSIQDVLDTREKIKLQVSEEIACDFPEPFCLKCGNILKCTNFNVQNIKIRYGKKIYGECQVVQWEVQDQLGLLREIIKLPTDLEVTLEEITDDDFDIANILQYRVQLPMEALSLGTDNFLPFNHSIRFEHYISDPLVLISTIPRHSDQKSCLEAKIDLCLMVPLRHEITLHLRERLHFPPSYFILPRRAKWLSTGPEKITRETYHDLLKYNDQAYEDYERKTPDVNIAPEATKLVDRMRGGVRDGVRRLSRLSMKITRSTSQLNVPDAESTPQLSRNASFQSETNIPGVSNDLYKGDHDLYNDDNIYEDYTGAMAKQSKNKKSIGSKLLRRLSKKGKRSSAV